MRRRRWWSASVKLGDQTVQPARRLRRLFSERPSLQSEFDHLTHKTGLGGQQTLKRPRRALDVFQDGLGIEFSVTAGQLLASRFRQERGGRLQQLPQGNRGRAQRPLDALRVHHVISELGARFAAKGAARLIGKHRVGSLGVAVTIQVAEEHVRKPGAERLLDGS